MDTQTDEAAATLSFRFQIVFGIIAWKIVFWSVEPRSFVTLLSKSSRLLRNFRKFIPDCESPSENREFFTGRTVKTNRFM
jgi:hypothetical protein